MRHTPVRRSKHRRQRRPINSLALTTTLTLLLTALVGPFASPASADPAVQCRDVDAAFVDGNKTEVQGQGSNSPVVVPGVGTFTFTDTTLTFTPAEGVTSIDLCVKGGTDNPRLFEDFTGGTVPNPGPVSNFVFADVQEDEEATAVPAEVTQSAACEVQGSFTVPATEGVRYLLDDVVVSGTVTGPVDGVLTAEALDGFVLTNPGFTQSIVIPAAALCEEPLVQATAVPAAVTLSSVCAVQGSFVVPSTEGVRYLLDDVAVSGTVTGPVDGVLTAEALDGFVLTDPGFTQSIAIPAAVLCPIPEPLVEATAVPAAVTQSAACEQEGSFVVPSTEGVRYLLGDTVVTGTVTGPVSDVLTAEALDGFVLDDPGFSQSIVIPAAQDCPVVPVVDPPTVVREEPVAVLPIAVTRPVPVAAAPVAVAGTSTTAAPAALPFTGSSRVQEILAASATLFLLGLGLMVAGRQRRDQLA